MPDSTLITEAEALGQEFLPIIGGFIIRKLDPTCDVTSAQAALGTIASGLGSLVVALDTKTSSATSASTVSETASASSESASAE